MCNACGFVCCALDCFDQCGCDGCEEEACWTGEDDEIDDDGPDGGYWPPDEERLPSRCCARRSVRGRFVCEALS